MFFKNHWDEYRTQWEFQDPKMEVRTIFLIIFGHILGVIPIEERF